MRNCLQYWDLCDSVPLDAAVALWCGVEPGELRSLGFSTSCMDSKREALICAMRDGRLDYEGRPVPRSDGRGMWHSAGFDELVEKDGIRIKKDSLRRFLLDCTTDRPAFLFDESRTGGLPDGSEVAEMNSMRALAVMAWLLAGESQKYKWGVKPNATAIGDAVEAKAREVFGNDTAGFLSFNKKLGKALKLLDGDVQKKLPWAQS